MKNTLLNAYKLVNKMVLEENIDKRKVLSDMIYEDLKAHLEEDKQTIINLNPFKKYE